MTSNNNLFLQLISAFIIGILLVSSVESSALITTCNNSIYIGIHCNTSMHDCVLKLPCKNNGTCHPINTARDSYNCSCAPGFNGTNCENDHRLCRPKTCSIDGRCIETSNTTFQCVCNRNWKGIYCETPINVDFCHNVTCSNRGKCKNSPYNYTCECVTNDYYGPDCEFQSAKLRNKKR